MDRNPVQTLRSALEALLDSAEFNYDAGETRKLVREGRRALQSTMPAAAHERAAGIFRYDPTAQGFVPASEDEAIDRSGNLRHGYQYLFKQDPRLIAA